MTFAELIEAKTPDLWPNFERGSVDEDHLLKNFFADGRAFDHKAFVEMMIDHYAFVNGMEEVLKRLKSSQAEIHAFSNYPEWYRFIEEKLTLSRYLDWTFLSCKGPMKGSRKPEQRAYEVVVDSLKRDPSEILLIDDREPNVEMGERMGFDAIHFKDAGSLISELQDRGWEL